MVAVAAYFDDSRRGGIWAVAGYMGHVTMFENVFAPEWKKALDEAPHPLSEFKTSACRQRLGEFAVWDRRECDDLTARLVSVITEACPYSEIVGYGAAVVLPEIPSREKGRRKMFEDLSYFLCMRLVVHDVLYANKGFLRDDGEVQVIFDTQRGQEGKARHYFEQIRRSLVPELGERVRPPIFEDSKRVVPLQAADLLAHETYKEVANRLEQPPRPVSKALRRLVTSRYHRATVIDTELLSEYVRQIKAGQPVTGPDAPVLYESDQSLRGEAG